MGIVSEKSAFSKKRKIAFFCGDLTQSGGTERVLSVIANGLAARGYPVFVISLWGGRASFFPLDQDIKIYWAEKEQKKKSIMGTLHYLTAVLRYERPDVLIDVDIILGCYSVFLKRRFPDMRWISWEHFNYYHHFRKNRLLRRAVRKIAARHADRLVVLTDADKRCYEREQKPRCKVSRIYNPLTYPLSDTECPPARDSRTIFAAGRLTRVKGFDLLIRSWTLLEKKYPEWQVVIAGEGEDEKSLKKQAEKAGLKRLTFAGRVSDMEDCYRSASFFVLPSRSEGFGMALTEAMYFSLPAVSYNCMAGPGEIIRDGETGFLVKPGDVRVFADRMELLMKDPELRKRMGARARSSVERFDKEGILDEWERLF